MRKAFLLGAGLGTRLQPLTQTLPKPLIPFANRPLITHILDHCLDAGITDFAINTHHLPEKWHETFPDSQYRGAPLTFFYEPILLETGGGLKNIQSWINHEPILVYNADILTDLPLDRLITTHIASNHTATLAVQDHGPNLHLTLKDRQITDIRSQITGQPGTHQFTGIYCLDPEFLDLIPEKTKISVIPAFLDLIKSHDLGAYLIKNHPTWLDLGTRQAYLDASFSRTPKIHPSAQISPTAQITNSWIGQNCQIHDHAIVNNSIIWPNSYLSQDAQLTNCIVHSTSPISGCHEGTNL